MMEEYITNYIEARKNKDAGRMSRIEKDMAKLGMDKMTLVMLANELEKEGAEND